MAKFDRGLLQRRFSQPVRVADDYVDLPDILHGFDPTACRLEDGLVFLVEDDGQPNPDFFRWVSGMAGRGKRSLESRRGYAYDVAGWIDFLHDAYQTDYLDAEFEDLEEYGRELRTASRDPVSGETWNRKLAIHDFTCHWSVTDVSSPVTDHSQSRTLAERSGRVRLVHTRCAISFCRNYAISSPRRHTRIPAGRHD